MKFRYAIVKHPTDYAVHEAYADDNGKIIALNGEPFTLYGGTVKDLIDFVNSIAKDIESEVVLAGDDEQMYDNFDKIESGEFQMEPAEEADNVITFKR